MYQMMMLRSEQGRAGGARKASCALMLLTCKRNPMSWPPICCAVRFCAKAVLGGLRARRGGGCAGVPAWVVQLWYGFVYVCCPTVAPPVRVITPYALLPRTTFVLRRAAAGAWRGG